MLSRCCVSFEALCIMVDVQAFFAGDEQTLELELWGLWQVCARARCALCRAARSFAPASGCLYSPDVARADAVVSPAICALSVRTHEVCSSSSIAHECQYTVYSPELRLQSYRQLDGACVKRPAGW